MAQTPSNQTFYMKALDRLPRLLVPIAHENGTPYDFTGFTGTARLYVAREVSGRRLVDGKLMTVEAPPVNGVLSYQWEARELFPGEYLFEVVLTTELPSGQSADQTFPTANYFKLVIFPRL